MIDYENPWIFNGLPFDADQVGDHIGFVYIVTCPDGKKYLGKKIFHNKVAKPPLKGKTKRRISKKDSNWKQYFGSGPLIVSAVAAGNKADFKREIVRLCNSKSEMGYWEAKLIFQYDCIISDGWLNDWISCRVQRNQLGKYIALQKEKGA